MNKTAIIALAVIGTLTAGFFLLKSHKSSEVTTSELKDIYNQWKITNKINVGAAEDDYRFGVFSSNYAKVQEHNKLQGRSFSLGLTSFAHLTHEEFAATHLGLKQPVGLHATRRNISQLSTDNIPKSVDWASKMNAVKNQGQCGSCWAFSTVGAVEGLHSVQKGNLYDLSEQELVDCSTSFGNEGCNGGLMDYGFAYVKSVGGLATEDAYPYTGTDGTCKSGLTRQAPISGFMDVTQNSSAALQAALAQQPVSVAIAASSMYFQLYTSGVLNSAWWCGTGLDHGVIAVGYDTTASTPFYKVRNSWGASWGEAGHVRLGIQDGTGVCGIQMQPSYPTL